MRAVLFGSPRAVEGSSVHGAESHLESQEAMHKLHSRWRRTHPPHSAMSSRKTKVHQARTFSPSI